MCKMCIKKKIEIVLQILSSKYSESNFFNEETKCFYCVKE